MKTYAGPFAGEDESTGSAGSVSASQLKDGIGLPFDEGKLAAKFIKRANELGMKQGPNESTTSDYCFSFEYGDGAMEGEMIVLLLVTLFPFIYFGSYGQFVQTFPQHFPLSNRNSAERGSRFFCASSFTYC